MNSLKEQAWGTREFLHVVSNCSENHSPVFFPLVCASFSSKNMCKKQAATGRFADFTVWENKRFLLLCFNNRLQKAPPSFFAYVLTGKRSANQRKKIQGCDFLLNRRPHAKIQLIWMKKKKTKQNSTQNGYAVTSSISD